MARKSSTASSSTTSKTSKRSATRSKAAGSRPAKTSKKAAKPAASAKKAGAAPAKSKKKSAAAGKKSAADADATSKKTTKKKAGSSGKSAKPVAEPKAEPAADAPAPEKKTKSKGKSSPKTAAKAAGEDAKPQAASKKTKKKSGKTSGGKSKSDGAAETPAPKFRGFRQSSSLTEMRAAAAKLASAAGLPTVKSSGDLADDSAKKFRKVTKSPLNAKQLAEFKEILLLKRAQLAGDVSSMELEALMGGGSGSLSHLPQHMADQGSDVSEQSLSLDLAASQRDLLREIDAALERIENGTFGICTMLGKPIRIERLRETPWARYSIEAARELERTGRVYRPGTGQ